MRVEKLDGFAQGIDESSPFFIHAFYHKGAGKVLLLPMPMSGNEPLLDIEEGGHFIYLFEDRSGCRLVYASYDSSEHSEALTAYPTAVSNWMERYECESREIQQQFLQELSNECVVTLDDDDIEDMFRNLL